MRAQADRSLCLGVLRVGQKDRRSPRAWRVQVFATSSRMKELALHHLVQQGANSPALFTCLFDDCLNCRAVTEGESAAGGVDRELLGEIAQQPLGMCRE